MPFIEETVRLELEPGGWPLRLTAPLCYLSERVGMLVVPTGFVTDLASVPRLFWRLFPPFGRYSRAAIVHDYLYSTPRGDIHREAADKVFRDAMAELGVGRFARTVIYLGVRIGGGSSWDAVRG